MKIYETENFELIAPDKPHIDRNDGGHIIIAVKKNNGTYTDRTKLDPKQAIELMRLSMLAAESFIAGMKKQGIDIVRINYQENGNWAYKPENIAKGDEICLHVHLYGRMVGKRDFPEALIFPPVESGFYDEFATLNESDCEQILNEIMARENNDKYKLEEWGL